MVFAVLLKHMRPILLAMSAINIAAACVWIGSIYVELPQRYAMLWVAIGIGLSYEPASLILDWFGYLGIIILVRTSHFISKRLSKWLKNTFAYYPGKQFHQPLC